MHKHLHNLETRAKTAVKCHLHSGDDSYRDCRCMLTLRFRNLHALVTAGVALKSVGTISDPFMHDLLYRPSGFPISRKSGVYHV